MAYIEQENHIKHVQDHLNTIEQIAQNLIHNQQWVEVMVLRFASAIMNHNKDFIGTFNHASKLNYWDTTL